MRPSWTSYFLTLAEAVASRATCPRKRVGVILVKDKMILATGYNGSPPETQHCDDIGCLVVDDHCVRTVHAEANAVAQAAKRGTSLNGATAYLTTQPCWGCLKLMASAGIIECFYSERYGAPYPLWVMSTTYVGAE